MGAMAATSVPNPASKIRRISGNPSSSPLASWCFDTVWKFDQIAGSPITFVVESTKRWRSIVASSIAFEALPVYVTGMSAAPPRHSGAPALTCGNSPTTRLTSAARPCASPPWMNTVKTGVVTFGSPARPCRRRATTGFQGPASRRRRGSRSGGARTSRRLRGARARPRTPRACGAKRRRRGVPVTARPSDRA